MMLLAQVPGADEVIKQASEVSWLAGLMAIVVISCITGFSFILRWIIKRQESVDKQAAEREARLAKRVDDLENTVNGKLFDTIQRISEVMGQMLEAATGMIRSSESMVSTMTKFSTMLENRPCLFDEVKRRKFFDELLGEEKATG